MRESREIYDNILDESKSELLSQRKSIEKLRQSAERKPQNLKIKLSLKKKKISESSRNKPNMDSDAMVIMDSGREKAPKIVTGEKTPKQIAIKKKLPAVVPIF